MSHEHDLALRRKVLSVGIGNVMEWYDFAVFGAQMDAIAFSFFPRDDGNSAFLYALIVYSSAFAMRPVGGFVLGYIGDQLGRTTALIVSMCLMLAPSFLIGCLPTFQSAGYVSSILLLLCRLVQGMRTTLFVPLLKSDNMRTVGFAGGGEMVSAIVYIVESTEKLGMPCFFGSICKASGNFGSTLGLGVVATLRALLSERAMLTWGWRIPFLMSIIFGALGMYLRSNLVETVEPSTPTSRVATDNEALLVPISDKENVLSRVATVDTWKRMIITIIIASTWSVAFYSILVWAAYFLADPSLSDTTCLNKRQIWITSFFMNVLVVILMPCFGFLGDAIGRGPSFLLTLSASILSVFAIPIFLLFRSNDVLSICFGYILFVIPISMFG